MTTYTANTTFYLRWYDHDDRACWYGSNASDFDSEHSLDQWVIPAQETTFYVCTNQSTTMFARIADTGDRARVYGAKFNTNKKGCNLRFTPMGALELEAGTLITDDPKFQIKQGGTTTSCTFTWDGRTWSYQIDGGTAQTYDCSTRPTISLTTADAGGRGSITLVDQTHAAGRAAIYHADASVVPSTTPLPTGTAVGLVDACEVMPSGGRVQLSASASDTTTYTLNLFVNAKTRLAVASG